MIIQDGNRTSVRCPRCGDDGSEVKDSRPSAIGIRRRRHCVGCGARYTTHETVTCAGSMTLLAWSAQNLAALYQSIPDQITRNAITRIVRIAAEADPDAEPEFMDEAPE